MTTYDSTYTDYESTPKSGYVTVQGDPEARKMIQLLAVCGLAALVSGILYAITGNKIVSAMPAGLVCLVCMLFYTPLAFVFLYSALPFEMLVRPSEHFTISKMMGVVVFVSYVLTRLGRRLDVPQVVKWLIFFGFFCFISVLWALLKVFSLIGVATILMHIGLIFLLVNTIKSIELFRMILWGLVIASALGTCLLLMGVGASVETIDTDRIAFEDMNPNVLGSQLAVSIIASIYLFLNARFIGKILSLSLCLLIGAGLLYTQARSAMFALFLGTAISLIMLMRGRNMLIYLALFILFCGAGVAGYKYLLSSELLGHKATERLRGTQYALQESGRLHYWKQGLQYIAERPLTGYGYRNFSIRYGGGVTKGKDAHNSFISITSELGIGGLFVFLMIHYLLLKKSFRIPVTSLKWLALSLLFFSILNAGTHTTYNHKDFWYAMGFVVLLTTIINTYYSNYKNASDEFIEYDVN